MEVSGIGYTQLFNQFQTLILSSLNAGENRIQKAAVDIIIDSAIDALLQDPARRFIYVETAFFSKWWNDQDDEMKDQVKMLVNEGRLGTLYHWMQMTEVYFFNITPV